jgi:hypothetical protein
MVESIAFATDRLLAATTPEQQRLLSRPNRGDGALDGRDGGAGARVRLSGELAGAAGFEPANAGTKIRTEPTEGRRIPRPIKSLADQAGRATKIMIQIAIQNAPVLGLAVYRPQRSGTIDGSEFARAEVAKVRLLIRSLISCKSRCRSPKAPVGAATKLIQE